MELAQNTYLIEVISPGEVKFKGPAVSATLPTLDGQISILANHAPLMAMISPGELVVITELKPFYFAIGEGLVKVSKNKAFILTDFAERPEEISLEEATRAKEELEEKLALKEKKADIDFEKLKTQLQLELAKLKVARRNSEKYD